MMGSSTAQPVTSVTCHEVSHATWHLHGNTDERTRANISCLT